MHQAWEGGLDGRRRATERSSLRKSTDKCKGGSVRLDAQGGGGGQGRRGEQVMRGLGAGVVGLGEDAYAQGGSALPHEVVAAPGEVVGGGAVVSCRPALDALPEQGAAPGVR